MVALVAGVVAGGLGLLLGSLSSAFDGGRHVIPSQEAFPAPSLRPSEPAKTGDAQNILLLGSDTRGPAPTSLSKIRDQRSDTMVLVHIPADGKHAYMISIMRDSWVSIPGHGKAKINAAFSDGGVPLTIRVVEGLFKVRIDHVAVVSFSGFSGLTNALGGVTVKNTRDFSNLGYHFPVGPVKLTGASALAYVRARYPFADGDYQRVRDQRAYLMAVAEEFLSKGTLLNPVKVHDSISTIAPYLLVDSGLNAGYVEQEALRLRGLKTSDIVSFTAPTDGTGMQGNQSVVYLDDAGIADLAEHLQNDTMDQFTGCSVHVC